MATPRDPVIVLFQAWSTPYYARCTERGQQHLCQPVFVCAANKNIHNHLAALAQLLTCHDDPLTISADELTDGCAAAELLDHSFREASSAVLLARASP